MQDSSLAPPPPMSRALTTPFRLAWLPIAAFLRLLGFGAVSAPAVGSRRSRIPVTTSGRNPGPAREREREARDLRGADRAAGPRRTPAPGVADRQARACLVAVIATLVASVGALAYFSGSGLGFASAVVGTTNAVTISPGNRDHRPVSGRVGRCCRVDLEPELDCRAPVVARARHESGHRWLCRRRARIRAAISGR